MRERLWWIAGLLLAWGCDSSGSEAVDASQVVSDGGAEVDAAVADASVIDKAFAIHERSIGSQAGALAETGTMSGAADAINLQLTDGTLPATVGRGDRLILWPGTPEEAVYFLSARIGQVEVTLQSVLSLAVVNAPYRLERAYPTISSWALATKGNLIGEKRREIGVCYHDAAFAENVVLSGGVTDAMHYRVLTVAEVSRHSGLAGTGAVVQPSVAGHGILVLEDFAQVEWLEVTDWTTNAAGSFDGINIKAKEVLIQNVIVHDDGHGDVLNSDAGGIQLERDLGTATVRNSMVYNLARLGIGTHTATGTVLTIQNSTAFACVLQDNNPEDYGCITARGPGSVVHAINVIALDAAGLLDFYVEPGAGASFSEISATNLSSDASAPGATPTTLAIAATVLSSVEAGNENLHLVDLSAAVDQGTSLAGEFNRDIDDQLRGAVWDIGADEKN